MKIAITGGTGFLGTYLIREILKKENLDFVILGTVGVQNEILIDEVKCLFIQINYTITSLVKAFQGCDGIIHLAAQKPVSKTQQDASVDFNNNIILSSNVFEAAKLLNIPNIVNVSTISVYGEGNVLPLSEDQKPYPDGYYGLSKLLVEELAEHYNRLYSMRDQITENSSCHW